MRISIHDISEAVRLAVKKKGGRRGCGSALQLRYLHDQLTSEDKFEDVAVFCPDLATIFLDNPRPEVLKMLDQFDRLRKLKFNKVTFEQLVETVSLLRKQITIIETVASHGTLDLGLLSQHCPDLEVLEIYYSHNVISKSAVKFDQLRKCVIYCTDLSGEAACDIIGKSPNIEHLNLSSATILSPASLQEIVSRGVLNTLQELALMSAPLLELSSLQLLVETLPSLKLLGRLEGWKLTASQVETFRKKIRRENYDVTLWYNLPMHLELDFDEDLLAL